MELTVLCLTKTSSGTNGIHLLSLTGVKDDNIEWRRPLTLLMKNAARIRADTKTRDQMASVGPGSCSLLHLNRVSGLRVGQDHFDNKQRKKLLAAKGEGARRDPSGKLSR